MKKKQEKAANLGQTIRCFAHIRISGNPVTFGFCSFYCFFFFARSAKRAIDKKVCMTLSLKLNFEVVGEFKQIPSLFQVTSTHYRTQKKCAKMHSYRNNLEFFTKRKIYFGNLSPISMKNGIIGLFMKFGEFWYATLLRLEHYIFKKLHIFEELIKFFR